MYTVTTDMDKSPVYICATLELAKTYGEKVADLFVTFDDTRVMIRDYNGHTVATKRVGEDAWKF